MLCDTYDDFMFKANRNTIEMILHKITYCNQRQVKIRRKCCGINYERLETKYKSLNRNFK